MKGWEALFSNVVANKPSIYYTYANSLTFTSSVNRGKLFIVSKAISLIVQHLEKAFQIIVVKEKELHKNVSLNIFECAKKSILPKSNNFFFTGFRPINVDLGAPSHEYTLFKSIISVIRPFIPELCQVKMCRLSMLLVWKFNFLPYRNGGNEKYVGPFFATYEHRRVRAPKLYCGHNIE
ncbi:hypothetical protein AGLY_003516 [Aphis glycines]|uniref:Uncharacterized protein n=1 Tax=Aphis glycines TaxID=307491 RepID=A0A6G0U189_APHGL|nr:hypothetical protein AGLY_003516 [Aphis glycines]